MKIVDQIGNQLDVTDKPSRIVSAVPSLTEYLFDLGLEEEIVGLTKFCVHPASKVKKKAKIGGTKKLNIEAIKELQPDLIIANKEENTKADISELQKTCNVLVTNIKDLTTALEALKVIGTVTHKSDNAAQIIAGIKMQSDQFTKDLPSLKVAYLIWAKPFMTIGGDTFINEMLLEAGYENVFASRNRYPTISLAQIKSTGAQAIFLSSEPFPFSDKHAEDIAEQTNLPVVMVDGERFSWYGSKLLFAYNYFKELRSAIHDNYDI